MINTTLWMSVSKETREKLREIFMIPKSSFIWIDGDVMKSDGVTDKDLEEMTDQKMQDFSGISGTSEQMFNECIKKLETPIENIENILKEETGFKCQHCEFIGKNKKSLNLHIIKKHKNG